MSVVAENLGVARSNLIKQTQSQTSRSRGRPPLPDAALVEAIKGQDVCDLMLSAVEHRFGPVTRLPHTIEWLTDNGSCYVAGPTRSFARELGLEPRTTLLESPQSNGMAEAFVRTIKRDYARVSSYPDARSVTAALPGWVAHYTQLHPHRALGCRSPREFIAARQTQEAMSAL
ncbi:Integrase core domain-containing protein [Microvirga guangxiensis]|uniref:Integrase core domain-containing protein n=1 Tax=Microvirga guangxiensis TaxID=549386 RepID=A0A1G5LL99_9HYPH|nr:Integrase core domain-containing protein [Microvirga guangxiensis]